MAAFNGKWLLASSSNLSAYADAIGASTEAIAIALPNLEAVGCLAEEYVIDTSRKMGRLNVYVDGELKREGKEFPLGVEMETESLDQRPIKASLTVEGESRLVRTETGSGYTARHVATVDGDTLTTIMTCGSVTATRTYNKV